MDGYLMPMASLEFSLCFIKSVTVKIPTYDFGCYFFQLDLMLLERRQSCISLNWEKLLPRFQQ